VRRQLRGVECLWQSAAGQSGRRPGRRKTDGASCASEALWGQSRLRPPAARTEEFLRSPDKGRRGRRRLKDFPLDVAAGARNRPRRRHPRRQGGSPDTAVPFRSASRRFGFFGTITRTPPRRGGLGGHARLPPQHLGACAPAPRRGGCGVLDLGREAAATSPTRDRLLQHGHEPQLETAVLRNEV